MMDNKKKYVYLAGAMEHSPDGGAKWREEISGFLINEMQHRVFNPCIEQDKILTDEERIKLRTWKLRDYPRFRETITRIIKNDLDTLLKEVDYIICFWDEYVLNGGGTQGELTMAFYNGIPVYMVSQIPRQQISSWILGCCSEVFDNFADLKQFLHKEY